MGSPVVRVRVRRQRVRVPFLLAPIWLAVVLAAFVVGVTLWTLRGFVRAVLGLLGWLWYRSPFVVARVKRSVLWARRVTR